MIEVSVKGLDGVVNLSGLDGVLADVRRACNRALERSGEVVCENAKSFVPVKTGALRDSIRIDLKDNAVSVGSTLSYACCVELGNERQAPQPFLQTGLAISGIEEIFVEELTAKE